MKRIPHTAFERVSRTKPRGQYVFSGPSKPPLRKENVVAMVPSASSSYDSTGLNASRSMLVGMFPITYQGPMNRSSSTIGAVLMGGREALHPPSIVSIPMVRTSGSRKCMALHLRVAQAAAFRRARFECEPLARRGVPEVDVQGLAASVAKQAVALRVRVFAQRFAAQGEHLHRQVFTRLRIEQARRIEDARIPVCERLHTTLDAGDGTTRRDAKAGPGALPGDGDLIPVVVGARVE